MSADDPTGYLPPHELRALAGSFADPASPGLATAAVAPVGGPTLPADDPASIAIAIARIAGEPFPMSVLPVGLTTPGIAPEIAPMGSPPAIAPELAPAPPQQGATPPAWSAMPTEAALPPMPPVPVADSMSFVTPFAGSADPMSFATPFAGSVAPGAAPMPTATSMPSGVAPMPTATSMPFGAAPMPTTAPPTTVVMPTTAAVPPITAAMPTTTSLPLGTAPMPTTTSMPFGAAPMPTTTSLQPTTAAMPATTSLQPTTAAMPAVTSVPPGVASSPTATSLPPTTAALPTEASLQPATDPMPVTAGSLPFAAVTDLGSFDPFGWEARVPFGANEEAALAQLPPVGGVGAVVPTSVPLIESPAPPPSPIRPSGGTAFDPYAVRRDFPILDERVHGGKRLVWLDNAATTQKPRAVIDRISYYYEHENSNVHRAAHALAARATDAYESARETTRKFLNASSPSEIVFVRGATEGINLIAKAWGKRYIERGDEIVLTHLEHHANIVPWQQLCAETGARLRVAPVDDRGDVILEEYERLLCSRTKLVTFTQVSNALGTITPAREMIQSAHRWGATVLLDGAQAVSHMAVDVQALDCDFYVFSGHKVFAPTGIGAVFGKRAILDAMPPWQGGGNMIADVTFERTLYQDPPWRFEAGTGNIADAAGMGAALDYVMRLGLPAIDRYEHELLAYATEQLATVPGLHMVGAPRDKAGVLSFILDGKRTEDVGGELDKEGIAVRSGHHCAQPILRRFGLEASIRASLAFYNVREDIDDLVAALKRLQAASV